MLISVSPAQQNWLTRFIFSILIWAVWLCFTLNLNLKSDIIFWYCSLFVWISFCMEASWYRFLDKSIYYSNEDKDFICVATCVTLKNKYLRNVFCMSIFPKEMHMPCFAKLHCWPLILECLHMPFEDHFVVSISRMSHPIFVSRLFLNE